MPQGADGLRVGGAVDPAALVGQRWFPDPGVPVTSAVVEEQFHFPSGGGVRILRIDAVGRSPVRCTLPVNDGSDPWRGLLDLALLGGSIVGDAGMRLEGRPASRRPGDPLSRLPASRLPLVRPLGLDQSHTSVVVDDALVLKLYRCLVPGPNPEVELSAALALDRDAPVPAFAGAIRLHAAVRGSARRPGSFDIAIVQQFVAGAPDEFEAIADGLAAWLRGGAPDDGGEVLLADVPAVGRAVARLHVALGRLHGRGLAPRVATATDVDARRRRARRSLLDAIRAARALDSDFAEQLIERRPAIERALVPLLAPGQGGAPGHTSASRLARTHGDLHLGQFIRERGADPSGDSSFLVVDLEGEPTRTAHDRRRLDLPLRDVASLLRGYDHVARSATRRAGVEMPSLGGLAGAHTRAIDGWLARARTMLVDAYRAELVDAGLSLDPDARLLHALEVERELYEFAYAARYLPAWRYASAAGLRWLLAHGPD